MNYRRSDMVCPTSRVGRFGSLRARQALSEITHTGNSMGKAPHVQCLSDEDFAGSPNH